MGIWQRMISGVRVIDRRSTLGISLLGLAAMCFSAATHAAVSDDRASIAPKPPAFPLYAFNNSMRGSDLSDPADQATLLKELGYAGIEGYDLTALPRLAEEIQKRGLKVFTVYLKVDIDGGGDPYDPRIETYLSRFLKDTGVILTVHLHSETYGSSDPAGDAQAVPILRKLADVAHEHGAKVAIYHHANFWAESFADGVRLSKKVNRRNLGAAFNLCHWLWYEARHTSRAPKTGEPGNVGFRLRRDVEEGGVDLHATLAVAAPHLMSVSLCGADGDEVPEGSGWSRLIQPLDEGSFDNGALLRLLSKLGYAGPVGLQCYNIKAPTKEHLRRSMEAWSAMGSADEPAEG